MNLYRVNVYYMRIDLFLYRFEIQQICEVVFMFSMCVRLANVIEMCVECIKERTKFSDLEKSY